MPSLPETILQFGSGRFLRAFADLFVHHGNEQGQAVGKIVVVQSTGDGRAGGLNAQGGRYHVVVRGLENGQVVDRVEECASVSRALHAGSQWAEVLAIAASPQLHTILSNTTEAGYALDPADAPTAAVPPSFPAKLLAVLKARFDAKQPAPTIIPCELIEGNSHILRDAVTKLAADWDHPAAFVRWLGNECVWLHTLVDRIVTGTPKDHPLLAADPMVIVAEPFAFWALEDHPRSRFTLQHRAITRAKNVEPYFLRKVRILNAAHTALLIKARPRGFAIVRDAVNDPELGAWLGRLFSEEIVPALEGRVDQPLRFAEQTIERFKNPFLDHKFADIAMHHESKMKVRLLPTRDEFVARFGKAPSLLTEVIDEGFKQLAAG
ncbi:MAG TPA: altronate dehydrogenase [Fimbriiglobus sp.]|nr:altronate dehydrogenase [Fimbriiglobus sp.]